VKRKQRKTREESPPTAFLLRDAEPTARELEGRPSLLELREARIAGYTIDDTPDPDKAKVAARNREIATDALVGLFLDAQRENRIGQLDPSLMSFIDAIRHRNAANLPKRKGGRPTDQNRRMLARLIVLDELKRRGGNHGDVKAALDAAKNRLGCSYELVRGAYYDHSPEWKLALKYSIALRSLWFRD